ncbi:hypothetical protein B0H11DRAFT_2261390 [Mycena galericulata]|nr:hypothetical protein B0H11DRAFT_2261390 [Mycena galericulata]
MTADGAVLHKSPKNNRVSSQDALGGAKPGVSRRASRGFFSLFSSKGQQPFPPQSMPAQHPRSSFPMSQPLPDRFDAISLTSPSQRNDPAFSRDPSVHHAHPLSIAPRRDVIRTSAPALENDPTRSLVPVAPPSPIVSTQENNPGTRYEDYYTTSYASQSSLTLPPSNDSFSSISPNLSPLPSRLPTPTGMPPDDPSTTIFASPLAETFDEMNLADRPVSPPPEYELFVEPRPVAPRNDSAPELRRIEPPGLPHRSATAPIPDAVPARRPNERRPQAYDLDRIDELDESNPLGVALHHEGPFQAIASVLKGPSPLGKEPGPVHPRNARAPKPGHNGGSLGISPGQVLPRNFQYYQPEVQPAFPQQDYNGSPQASTSYIPAQPLYSNMQPPHVGQEQRFNPDPRWQQAQPPTAHAHYDPRASYIPPQTQYDPVDDQRLSRDPYYPQFNPTPSVRHSSYSSEDSSAAYGGIEVDTVPIRDRRSDLPAPQAQAEPYFALQAGANGFHSQRQSTQMGFPPHADPRALHDPSRLDAGQNLSNMRHSPNGQPMAGSIDPWNRDQLNMGQNLSGMQRSPGGRPMTEFNDPRLGQQAYPTPQVAGYTPSPQDELDRRRTSSYHPTPTAQHFNNNSPLQQQNGQRPMAEHDPRRRASYQPSYQPALVGAAPVDLGRQRLERSAYQQQLIATVQDRPQSVQAPSIATTTNPRRPQPQHIPKHLVMPTPLQQSSQLPAHSPAQSYPAEHYPTGPQPARFNSTQAQPTRAQKIQMVQDKDGGRQLLRKRSSVAPASTPSMPPKAPPVTRQRSYMEPPPTVPETPVPRPMQQEKKRHKKLLSKRRSDL